jgi:hypothetical protein
MKKHEYATLFEQFQKKHEYATLLEQFKSQYQDRRNIGKVDINRLILCTNNINHKR